MADSMIEKLVVAISSRVLFDLEDSHRVFEQEGVEAFSRHQVEREEEPLAPGVAYPLVKKLLALNSQEPGRGRVEVILISRNSADTGMRVFNSIRHHNLEITRAAFAGGGSPFQYVKPFGAHLFLSVDPEDVRKALDDGFAAATILPGKVAAGAEPQLRIAFDGDAVIFSDEAERVYKQDGLVAFNDSEKESAGKPLPGGPFRGFLAALHPIQGEFPPENSPIRTVLVTARGAPAHAWDIRIDEALFLGGMDKGSFLETFQADIFFDDQHRHCQSARQHVPTGHVPYRVANKPS